MGSKLVWHEGIETPKDGSMIITAIWYDTWQYDCGHYNAKNNTLVVYRDEYEFDCEKWAYFNEPTFEL